MKIFGLEIIVRKWVPDKQWFLIESPENWVMSKGDGAIGENQEVVDKIYNLAVEKQRLAYVPPMLYCGNGPALPKSLMVPGKTLPTGDIIDGIIRKCPGTIIRSDDPETKETVEKYLSCK